MSEYRIVAENMSVAMRRLSEELGPDAMLLSSRTVFEGVELVALPPGEDLPATEPGADTAAEDRAVASGIADDQRVSSQDATELPDSVSVQLGEAAQRLAEAIGAGVATAAVRETSSPESYASLHSELQQVRKMLEGKLRDVAFDPVLPDPVQYHLLERTLQTGLPMKFANRVLKTLPDVDQLPVDEAWSRYVEKLESHLPVSNLDPVARGGHFILCGPVAAGKTSALIKLAARQVMQGGHRDIAIISTDQYSSAGRASLEHFARISRVALFFTDREHTLADRLAGCARYRLVLIDTAAGDAGIDTGGSAVQRLVVIPAYAERQWAEGALRHYAAAHCGGCILTHLDSAVSLGQLMGMLDVAHLPLLYTCSGALLPDYLNVADGAELLAAMLQLLEDGPAPFPLIDSHAPDPLRETTLRELADIPTVNMSTADESTEAAG